MAATKRCAGLAAGFALATLASFPVLPSAQQAPPRVIDDAALAAESPGNDWLAFGRTYSEQRFSPLTRIDTATVDRLAVDWYVDLPGDRGLVSTPLVVDGVMYFVRSMNVVRAVDAATGDLLWEYAPPTSRDMPIAACGWAGTTAGASRSGRARCTSPRGTGG